MSVPKILRNLSTNTDGNMMEKSRVKPLTSSTCIPKNGNDCSYVVEQDKSGVR